jgi:hypothetical protein
MNRREESTVEEARPLRRLYSLNAPAEDINLVVGAMQRRGQSSGVARDNTHSSAEFGQDENPPSESTS